MEEELKGRGEARRRGRAPANSASGWPERAVFPVQQCRVFVGQNPFPFIEEGPAAHLHNTCRGVHVEYRYNHRCRPSLRTRLPTDAYLPTRQQRPQRFIAAAARWATGKQVASEGNNLPDTRNTQGHPGATS